MWMPYYVISDVLIQMFADVRLRLQIKKEKR